jgi:hypothetical protein
MGRFFQSGRRFPFFLKDMPGRAKPLLSFMDGRAGFNRIGTGSGIDGMPK